MGRHLAGPSYEMGLRLLHEFLWIYKKEFFGIFSIMKSFII